MMFDRYLTVPFWLEKIMKNKILIGSILVTSIIALLYNVLCFGFGSDTIFIADYMPGMGSRYLFPMHCLMYLCEQLFLTFLVCLAPMLISCFVAKNKGVLTWKYIQMLPWVPLLLASVYLFIFVSPRFGATW